MKKINVLHFRNCRGISTLTGPETYFLNLLKNKGVGSVNSFLAFTVNPLSERGLFIEELQKHHIPFQAIPVSQKYYLKDFWTVNRIIKDCHIDLLHTHDARTDVLGFFLSRLNHIPLISFAHGWLNWVTPLSKDRVYAFLEMKAVSLSDWIVVASLDMKRDLISRKVPETKINHIPYGIDLEKFTIKSEYKSKIRRELGIPEECFLIGTVGRIHPWKGQRYLIEAAEILTRTEPQARFLIVGDAAFDGHRAYQIELAQLVKELNLQDKVIFAGSRKDIPEIMNALDLFVLPSLREPFGIVIIEAQACGKPVIASAVGGISEAIKDGETGILVKAGDSKVLAAAINRLLADRETRERMGAEGRKRVEEIFSAEAMVRKTEKLYNMILKVTQ